MSDIMKVSDLDIPLAKGIRMKGASVICATDAGYDAIEKAVTTMAALDMVTQWCVGDLVLQGRELLGEEFAQIESSLGYSLKTLNQYAYMSRAFAPDERRNACFDIHAIVVSFDKAKRKEYLDLAVDNDMPVSEFRKYVKTKEGSPAKGDGNDHRRYVVAKLQVPIDMGMVYGALADETNQQLTEDDLMTLGISSIENNDSVWVICMRKDDPNEDGGGATPKKKAADVVEEAKKPVEAPKKKVYENMDELLTSAKVVISQTGRASTSSIQRRLKIGYTTACDVMEALEQAGIIGPPESNKPREVLVSKEELDSQIEEVPFS